MMGWETLYKSYPEIKHNFPLLPVEGFFRDGKVLRDTLGLAKYVLPLVSLVELGELVLVWNVSTLQHFPELASRDGIPCFLDRMHFSFSFWSSCLSNAFLPVNEHSYQPSDDEDEKC